MEEIEQNIVVYPPNKNLQRQFDLSTSPVIYKHLLFLDINDNGKAIVGSSNLSGSLWEGTLLHFNNTNALIDMNYDKSYISSTASDGKFLNDYTIVLAEDTGILNIISLKDKDHIQSISYFKHSERIPKINVWKSDGRILTCSGRNLYLWDSTSTTGQPIQRYENYHCSTINAVDVFKYNCNIFLSGANDGKCALWDARENIPASGDYPNSDVICLNNLITVLYNYEFGAVTSVAFKQNNSNYALIGTETGDIYLLDKREPKEFVATLQCFDNAIYRMSYNVNNDKLAVCGHTNVITIINLIDNYLETISTNQEHQDMVRDLIWYENNLFSCGFDRKIMKY